MKTPTESTYPARRSRRLWRWLAIGALILIVLGGAVALIIRDQLEPGPAVAGVTEVAVRDNEFAPAAIEVPAGTNVTWQWDGEVDHNVVGDGFESPVQTEGTFSQSFPEPGTYAYECKLHFFMRGEVVVTS